MSVSNRQRRFRRFIHAYWVLLIFSIAMSAYGIQRVNINTADVDLLSSTLPGIGPVKAAAIVNHRETHGPFTTVEQLLDVPGIGPVTMETLRPLVSVSDEANAGTTSSGMGPLISSGRIQLTVARREILARVAVQSAVARVYRNAVLQQELSMKERD
ncbi:MAG: helix-hairpin-helix domain-containing protein [Granulosicoccus sp.]